LKEGKDALREVVLGILAASQRLAGKERQTELDEYNVMG
jgi:hypothetical protein